MRSKRTPPRRTKIFDMIRASGTSQQTVSKLTGLSPTQLSRICRGITQPDHSELVAIAGALGVPVEQLKDPLAGLQPDQQAIEKLVAFLRGPEGGLMVGRLLAALEG